MASSNKIPLDVFKTTFVISKKFRDIVTREGVDRFGSKYLENRFGEGKDSKFVPESLIPLSVPGDGNCAMSSVSSAIYGYVKIPEFNLREAVASDLKGRQEEYRAVFSKSESFYESMESIIRDIESPAAYLNFAHVFAACNIVRRPIIVLSSLNDRSRFGEGEGGIEATFVPFMRKPEECVSKFPLIIAWNSVFHNHFVPLIPMEPFIQKGDFSMIPRPAIAFWKGSGRTEEELLAQYVDFGAEVVYPPVYYELIELAERHRAINAPSAGSDAAASTQPPASTKKKPASKSPVELFLLELAKCIKEEIEEQERPIDVVIRTGDAIIREPFRIETLEPTALKVCKKHHIPLNNARLIADSIATCRDDLMCGSPLRRPGIPGSPALGIPSTTLTRFADPPGEDCLEQCKKAFDRIVDPDFWIHIANLSNVMRCLLYGDIILKNEEAYIVSLNVDYKRLTNCIGIFAVSPAHKVPYCFYDYTRTAVLHPVATKSFASWSFVSKSAFGYSFDDIEFYAHVTFLKYLANFMATEGIASNVMGLDSVYEYLTKMSTSKTPEILSLLATVFLNAVINYPFEDFDTYCMRLIIKLLGSDTVNQDTADVLLTALGTLFVKDKNALLVAKTDHTEDVKAIAARHSKNPKANFVLNAVLKTGEDTN